MKMYEFDPPWYMKLIYILIKPKLKPEVKNGLEKLWLYKNIEKDGYTIDYDYSIKEKRFNIGIKIIF